MPLKQPWSIDRTGNSVRLLRQLDRTPRATLMALAMLVAFYWVVYFAAPAHLPYLLQRFVGLSNALLAMVLVLFADSELGPRLRLATTWRASRLASVAAATVFIVIFAWWLSPWAPIQVGGP